MFEYLYRWIGISISIRGNSSFVNHVDSSQYLTENDFGFWKFSYKVVKTLIITYYNFIYLFETCRNRTKHPGLLSTVMLLQSTGVVNVCNSLYFQMSDSCRKEKEKYNMLNFERIFWVRGKELINENKIGNWWYF